MPELLTVCVRAVQTETASAAIGLINFLEFSNRFESQYLQWQLIRGGEGGRKLLENCGKNSFCAGEIEFIKIYATSF